MPIFTFGFRFKPQTLQGADILAEELKAQVIMPDFFEGHEPWPLSKFPPKTDEDKKKYQEWFGSVADPAKRIPRLIKAGETLKEDGAEFVVGYGYCWGKSCTRLGLIIEMLNAIIRWQSGREVWRIRHAIQRNLNRSSCVRRDAASKHAVSSLGLIRYRMLSADDAEVLEVPLGLYISNDEPKDEVSASNDADHRVG